MTTQPPVSAYGSYKGTPGSITRYFWVQAIYPSGRAVLSNLVTIENASSLGQYNQINIAWSIVPGAIGFDVIETPTSTEPTVNSTATIGVALGVTGQSLTLTQEPVLVSWTYEAGNGSTTLPGTIADTQVAFGDGTDSLTGSADLTWDGLTLAITGSETLSGSLAAKTVNYIATESGANNAIAGTFTGAPTLVAGLRVSILLAHTLQAGANTFAYAGGAAKDIKSHLDPANNIATAYAVGSLVDLMYDGTQWQDMSQ